MASVGVNLLAAAVLLAVAAVASPAAAAASSSVRAATSPSRWRSQSLSTCWKLRSFSSQSPQDSCVYTIYVRTGSIWKGGTDSVISLALADSSGAGVNITNLEEWGGLMGPGYDYYERGNLDIFSGRGPCLAAPPCWMELYSDGSGPHHGWYCNYVEVTTTGPHVACAQQLFTVEQWLATDVTPYELTTSRDYCSQAAPGRALVKEAAVGSMTLVNWRWMLCRCVVKVGVWSTVWISEQKPPYSAKVSWLVYKYPSIIGFYTLGGLYMISFYSYFFPNQSFSKSARCEEEGVKITQLFHKVKSSSPWWLKHKTLMDQGTSPNRKWNL